MLMVVDHSTPEVCMTDYLKFIKSHFLVHFTFFEE